MYENDGKIEFIYDQGDGGSVRLSISADAPLNDVLEAFEKFLQAAGYSFNGMVDIIEINEVNGDIIGPNTEMN